MLTSSSYPTLLWATPSGHTIERYHRNVSANGYSASASLSFRTVLPFEPGSSHPNQPKKQCSRGNIAKTKALRGEPCMRCGHPSSKVAARPLAQCDPAGRVHRALTRIPETPGQAVRADTAE